MITVPPAFLTSTAPAAPSEPEPVKITAISARRRLAAVESSKSTEGRGRPSWSSSRQTSPSWIATWRFEGTT